ncbi:MAG: hypothetical protein PHH70_02815, partial [Candidatus Gracilibacteria bacterium]|nr:hypothetical protein [Candidatus Gracilibacteria bacterium]
SLIKNFNSTQLDAFIKRFTNNTPPAWTQDGAKAMHQIFHEGLSRELNEVATVGEMIAPEGGRAGLSALVIDEKEAYYTELVKSVNDGSITDIQNRLTTLQQQDPSLAERVIGWLSTIGIGVRNIPFLGMLAGIAGEKQTLSVTRGKDRDGQEKIGIEGQHPASVNFNIGAASLTAKARFFEATLGLHTDNQGQELINNTETFIATLTDKIPATGEVKDINSIGTLSPTEKKLVEAYNEKIDNIGQNGKNILIEALANMHMVEMAQKNPGWHFKGVEAGLSFMSIVQGLPPFFFGIFVEKLGTEARGGENLNANTLVESGINTKKGTTLEDIGIKLEQAEKNKKFTTTIPFPAEGTPFYKELTNMGATLENENGKLTITVPKTTYLAFGKREIVTSEATSVFYTVQQVVAAPAPAVVGGTLANGVLPDTQAVTPVGSPATSPAFIVYQQRDTDRREDIEAQFSQLGGALYLARRHDLGGNDNTWDKKHEAMYKQFDTFFQLVGNEDYDGAVTTLKDIKNPHAKRLFDMIDRAEGVKDLIVAANAKRSILVSALSFTYGGKNTRTLDKVKNVGDIVKDYTQKFVAEEKLITPNTSSRAFFIDELKKLKKGAVMPTLQLSAVSGFENRIIGSVMCATPLGGAHYLDAIPGSSEVYDPIWIDGINGDMPPERKKAILDKSATTIALGVAEMEKYLTTQFPGKGLKITPQEYRTLLLDNTLPEHLIKAGVEIDKKSVFFDAMACIKGSRCLNDQAGVVHTTIKGAPVPPAPLAAPPTPAVAPPAPTDTASIGMGATVGTDNVTVWALDPSLGLREAQQVSGAGRPANNTVAGGTIGNAPTNVGNAGGQAF